MRRFQTYSSFSLACWLCRCFCCSVTFQKTKQTVTHVLSAHWLVEDPGEGSACLKIKTATHFVAQTQRENSMWQHPTRPFSCVMKVAYSSPSSLTSGTKISTWQRSAHAVHQIRRHTTVWAALCGSVKTSTLLWEEDGLLCLHATDRPYRTQPLQLCASHR